MTVRLRTAHKRKAHKLRGSVLPKAALDRVLLCNRFAASNESYVRFFCHRDFGAGYWLYSQMVHARITQTPIGYHFKSLFYSIKDRIMDRFGKFKGYTLQHWTSYAEDYYGDYGMKDGCHHYHILERVKLGSKMLHRPTGHFSFYNQVSDYDKETAGFRDLKKLCTETIEGKKRITQNVPDKTAALAALRWLCLRYGHLPVKEKERPRLRVHERAYYFAPPVPVSVRSLDDDSIPF